jgi:predicted lipoprotein
VRRLGAALVALVLCACSGGPTNADVVQSMANGALIPAMEAASVQAAALESAVSDFCLQPAVESQEAAQEAWRATKQAWQRSILTTWFGPAQMLRTVSHVDYEPIDEEGIDELLASSEVLDVDYMTNQAAATQRGLGSIEYLLFDNLERAGEPRVCEMMMSTASVVASETLALETAWTDTYEGGSPFVERFLGETMTPEVAMANSISAIVETLKQMSLFQIGKALGISAQEPSIEAIPEGRAGFAADAYVAQLESIRSLLDGGGEASLGALIDSRSVEISEEIDDHLAAAMAALEAIDAPLRQVAADSPDELQSTYDHLSELLRIFEADVVSLLDITLGFSDADGDTG